MAGAGFGRGMALIATRECSALAQPLEAAFIIGPIFAEEIGGKLIDRDGDDQPGRRGGTRWHCRLGKRGQGCQQQEGMNHFPEHLFNSFWCLDGATLRT